MTRCRKIDKGKCEKCDRSIKKPPRICLPIENYQSCHKLCRWCWKKYRWDNYDRDLELQKNYAHCIYCREPACYYCGARGKWQEDIRKVLCYDCL